MTNEDWMDDDREEKVDLRLWRKLLQYTLRKPTTPHRPTCPGSAASQDS